MEKVDNDFKYVIRRIKNNLSSRLTTNSETFFRVNVAVKPLGGGGKASHDSEINLALALDSLVSSSALLGAIDPLCQFRPLEQLGLLPCQKNTSQLPVLQGKRQKDLEPLVGDL